MRSETRTLSAALYELAYTVESGDGVANAVLAEAAERLDEQTVTITGMRFLMAEASKEITAFADELKQGSTIGGEWDGSEEEAKDEYDRLMALAERLTPNAPLEPTAGTEDEERDDDERSREN